jgi:hypothetical protein
LGLVWAHFSRGCSRRLSVLRSALFASRSSTAACSRPPSPGNILPSRQSSCAATSESSDDHRPINQLNSPFKTILCRAALLGPHLARVLPTRAHRGCPTQRSRRVYRRALRPRNARPRARPCPRIPLLGPRLLPLCRTPVAQVARCGQGFCGFCVYQGQRCCDRHWH